MMSVEEKIIECAESFAFFGEHGTEEEKQDAINELKYLLHVYGNIQFSLGYQSAYPLTLKLSKKNED